MNKASDTLKIATSAHLFLILHPIQETRASCCHFPHNTQNQITASFVYHVVLGQNLLQNLHPCGLRKGMQVIYALNNYL